MTNQITIRMGAADYSVTVPGGKFDLSKMRGEEKKTVSMTLIKFLQKNKFLPSWAHGRHAAKKAKQDAVEC